ncbi:MAG: TetR/AcrR family transcriptional regulator [Thermoleophilia bacterium]|nr:TetR/AcrR family transcriptional regulator [Thermoleophilia bacterium]
MVSGPSQPGVRERILAAARRLFIDEGFRAVGIDRIIAEAGVAKMSLYRHFPSKDDLIVAHLEASNRQFWEWLEGAVADIDEPRARMVGIFAAVERLATSPACVGCTFQSAAAEFPERGHPGHQVAIAHKQAVIDRFTELGRQADLDRPEDLAAALLLLMDGAWTAARVFGPVNPARGLEGAAAALIAAHER